MEPNTQIPIQNIPQSTPVSAPMPATTSALPPKKFHPLLVVGLIALGILLVGGGVFLLRDAPKPRDIDPIVNALNARQAKTLTPEEKEAIVSKLKNTPKKELTEAEQESILQALQNKK